MKKKTTKILVMALALVLVAGIAIGGTIAYLTSTPDPVINTFSIGKVTITLDETKVDPYGVIDTTATDPVKANEYKLIPGHSYTKDPTVHVDKSSEPCYVFVKVENGIGALNLEASGEGANPIANQITSTYGWTLVTGETNVYYKEVTAQQLADAEGNTLDLKVFGSFKLADNAEFDGVITADDPATEEVEVPTSITITAYAIQKDGLTVAQAWAAFTTSNNG